MAVGKNKGKNGKMERGSIIIFPMILRLFGRIASGEKRKVTEISGKKIKIIKNVGGEDYQVVGNYPEIIQAKFT